MRKFLFTIAFAIASVAAANSQVFIGGGLGFNWKGGEEKQTGGDAEFNNQKTPSEIGFSINPKVGYFFNDRFLLGVELGFGYSQGKKYGTDGNSNYKEDTMSWEVAPYVRCAVWQHRRFGVWINSSVYAYGSRVEPDPIGTNIDDIVKGREYGAGVRFTPVLTYDVSRHIQLETSLNFCGLGYSFTKKTEQAIGANETRPETTKISHSVDYWSSDRLFQIGAIQVGFLYRF